MKSVQKIDLGLTGYDELFMNDAERKENKLPRIYDIPLSEIDDFPDHPFKVKLDEDMDQLVQSIKERGIITPVTLRPKEDGRYEIVSGHRRKKACELAGFDTVKAEVREMTRDEAIILMVESNLQRSVILPSEKAFSYKMRLEAMNRQGQRSDLTSTPVVSKSRSNEELGSEHGESREQVRRYIFSSWFDFREELKTDEFKAEFDDVINSLREEGDILHNRRALAKYCYCTPQSRMQEEPGYYGVRVDTEKYAYLLRLNPDRGEYNLYCYCYRRDWLDQHLKDAEKGIRFIDSHYKELFRIPDGGRVKIHYSWNEDQIRTCRYIDDYHVEIGSNPYHICEFAERMEYGGHTCEPVRDNLPEQCYTFENYKYMYETFVRHQIGSKTVSSLRKTDIKRFYNYLADERHLKPATIDNIHTVLHQILDMAVDDDYIRNNPSNNVLKELKQSHCFQTEKRRALTKPEQELFLDYLKNSPTSKYWYPVFAVMIGTGLRVGEVTGLRWCDIDLEEGIIDVNHTLVYYDHRTEGSKRGCYFNVNTTKTPAGRRKVPMLGFVKEAFLMEKERQELLDLHCEATVDGYTDFIFINRFGQPQHQATLNKAIRRIIRDCNDEQLLKDENAEVLLPHFSCHSLRHTFTTRMCEAGVNVKVIQDTLGHKDISTTLNIYTDVTKELRKSEFEGLDSYFKNEYNKVSV